ncbi:T-cell surface protein tactile [Kryptolebias marmoratus]|uniref:T-cell surface protein tactile n=1 Tax=Kryptolebias marmoratus TaxID=37003 RepID=UPI0007F89F16|nr:T-cell surface protein tactile [Kryptolebias marmoratus]
MTGKAQEIVFSLLLLASINQGLQNPEMIHNETLEAEVGQNVSLPCIMKNVTGLKIVNVEWKKDETKLVVYNPSLGHHHHWSNVTIQIKKTGTDIMGSYLLLPWVNKWDSGIYVCEITSFPLGSIKKETNLTVKDAIKIACDTDDIIEVYYGENASIHCSVSSDVQYRWTKDQKLVSENNSLELWWVTDAQAGAYKLTVKTGDKTLHRDFTITVLTATTSLRTDAVTVSPQGRTDSAHSSFTTLQTEPSTRVNWTTHPNLSNITVTDVGNTTSPTSLTPTGIPSSPDAHSSTYHSLNFTTSSNATAVPSWTQETVSEEMRNESRQTEVSFSVSSEEFSIVGNVSEHPPSTPTKSVKVTVFATESKGTTRRTHLLVLLLIMSLLFVIIVLGFLRWRQIKEKRMDLPPPFKPPPPPIKYTAAKRNETSVQTFPTSRCNSIAEPRDMREMHI